MAGYNTVNPYDDPYVFTIMGRIHVGTSDSDALQHAVKSLRSVGTIDARLLFYYCARCIGAHHINRGEYRRIMTGRV